MDFAPGFQMGHPVAFEFAAKLSAMLPGDLDPPHSFVYRKLLEPTVAPAALAALERDAPPIGDEFARHRRKRDQRQPDEAERRAIAEAEAAELAESTGAETHADEGAGEEA